MPCLEPLVHVWLRLSRAGACWRVVDGIPGRELQQRITMESCQEYARLVAYVENVLGNLAQLTTLHLELFRAGDFPGARRLDKELEQTVGEKERAIGALRQHMIEHK